MGEKVQAVELALLVETEIADVAVISGPGRGELAQELTFDWVMGPYRGVMALEVADPLPTANPHGAYPDQKKGQAEANQVPTIVVGKLVEDGQEPGQADHQQVGNDQRQGGP